MSETIVWSKNGKAHLLTGLIHWPVEYVQTACRLAFEEAGIEDITVETMPLGEFWCVRCLNKFIDGSEQ